jgi:polar amino acid transport system substrate-binding protein
MPQHRALIIGAVILASALAWFSAPSAAADQRVEDLVKAGKIRLALFLPQYTIDASGGISGVGAGLVAIDLASALAARLGVKAEITGYPSPAKVVECLKAGACDMTLVGIEGSRAAEVDFSPPVLEFDFTYLVPAGSAIRRVADVDRQGTRVAVVNKHGSTMALARQVKHAELIGADIPDGAFELLHAGKADAFASARWVLVDYAVKLPGSRVLDDAYGVNPLGIALPKGLAGRLAYVGEFIEEARASGLIQGAIDRADLKGFRVSPAAAARRP